MIVYPFIYPNIQWDVLSSLYSKENNPIKKLDQLRVKLQDPTSFYYVFNLLTNITFSFIIVLQYNTVIDLLKSDLTVHSLGECDEGLILLVSGNLLTWREVLKHDHSNKYLNEAFNEVKIYLYQTAAKEFLRSD